MHDDVITFLFTDIEGSTRLWEQEPERMRPALARHDEIVRAAVEARRGKVVKMTGDGLHAAFGDALDAVLATLDLQQALQDPAATAGLALRIRCGLHAGPSEGRDGDYFGTVVNRAARIMSAAHGGQMLLSQAVAERLDRRLPDGVLLRDLGSVRLRDLANAERMYQLVHPGLRSDFPPLRSLEATPNNLPQAVASFVGRSREIKQVGELLSRHRLVSLVGMGGLGKTRLSLHVAAEALDDFADGAWLVELGPLREADRVATAIAATLGVKEESGRPIEEALARFVRNRTLLIVLDNCEHLLEASAAAARHLLSAGAGVRILATSREALRIAGEATYILSGLPVPGPLEATVPEALAGYESVQLFVDRATAALPGFRLDGDNATVVAAICHRLDGIPLAIELAAARTRSISVPQIAARLKDRFRLLTGGDPTAMPRQRTLRALIDWSHDLLPDDERALFRRLAVFSGGWTLEACESVCAGDDVPQDMVLELLGRLVEKSLVSFDDAAQRYRMLETVRQYAHEQLEASGESRAFRDRHLAFFVSFAESAKPQLSGPLQAEWLARVAAEHDNILAAHEWAGRSDDHAPVGLKLVNSVKLYWVNRGYLELGLRVTLEALERPGAQSRDPNRAQGLFNAGQMRYFMGRHREARSCLEESLGIARQLGDAYVATVLQPLGLAALGEGDTAMARKCFEEAVHLTDARGDKRSLAGALNALAMVYRVERLPHNAHALYDRIVSLCRESGNQEAEAIALLNFAMVSIDTARPSEAASMVREALRIVQRVDSVPAGQSALEVCAGLAAVRGDWRNAGRFSGAADSQALRSGARRDSADQAFLEPKLRAARESAPPAAYAAAESEGRALALGEALSSASAWLEEARAPVESAPEQVTASR
ncbi:MAG TPA: adenylate/guanylate cyclase domain-containing protein [Usitatibacter sp.]|nr:adenylate/guanylate cyclase domain-containing protein [Usitatibacter sp.]